MDLPLIGLSLGSKVDRVADTRRLEVYFDLHERYSRRYGPRTLVLVQTGSLYQASRTPTRGPDLKEVAGILNVTITRRDRGDITEQNPELIGFPLFSSKKYLNTLTGAGYTVVTVDRVPDMKGFGPRIRIHKSRLHVPSATVTDECGLCSQTRSDVVVLECGHRLCRDCVTDSDDRCPSCDTVRPGTVYL